MTSPQRTPDRWIDLGHARIPVWMDGAGPVVLFVHGWPLTSETWRNVFPHLTDICTCVTFDLPGAGQSTWDDPSTLTLDALANAIVAVADAVAPDQRVVLVGHDSGGGVAREAAVTLGDRVAGMVMGNTEIPHVHSWRFAALFAILALPGASALLVLLLRTQLGRYLLFRDAVVNRRLIAAELSPRFLQPLVDDERRLAGALGVISGVRASDFDALADAHPRIVAPVRLVWGVRDPWFPLSGAREMLASFGGTATLAEVPDAGLLVHEERPERFAAEVRDLLSEIREV